MRRDSEFVKLLAASFVSQTGSYFLTIALAGFVLAESGSVVAASLVFTLSYLPSIFVGSGLGDWLDRRLSRRLLVWNEAVAILISLLCGICIGLKLPLAFLCALVSLRSILLSITRTGGLRWIKLITPPEDQAKRAKLFLLSFFLSTAVAGILVAQVLRQPSIRIVVVVDVVTYLLSICILLWLRSLPTSDSAGVRAYGTFNLVTTIRAIVSQPVLAVDFYSVCFSQAIFQGAYSVLISYLPIARFHVGVHGIGRFQIAASSGIILGFIMLWVSPDFLVSRGMRLVTVLLAGISLVACVSAPTRVASILCFFLLLGAFEIVWLFSSARIFQNIPKESIGRYQFVMTSTASCVMAFFTLLYSFMIEYFGLRIGIISIMSVGLLVWLFLGSRDVEQWKTL